MKKRKLDTATMIAIGVLMLCIGYIYYGLNNAYEETHVPDGPYEITTLSEIVAGSDQLVQIDATVHWVIAPNAVLVTDDKAGMFLVTLVSGAR